MELNMERKVDKLIWYFMATSMSILIIGGGAWATSINSKVEKISALEVNVQYIQTDLKDIKGLIKNYILIH